MQKEYLYHYTTINTLPLILKYKTIRFNTLENVDDLEECQSRDLESIGKYCFVSCWTKSDKENIALWHMYSKKGVGVRLKLPINPFKIYTNKEVGFQAYTTGYIEPIETGSTYPSIFPSVTLRDGFYLVNPVLDEFLLPITYTDDKDSLFPNVLKPDGSGIDMRKVGCFKNTSWFFQEEWRYRFLIYPYDNNKTFDYISNPNIFLTNIVNQVQLPISTFDLGIADDCFKDMEITLGPSATNADEILVNSLINTHNPSAIFSYSKLKDKICLK